MKEIEMHALQSGNERFCLNSGLSHRKSTGCLLCAPYTALGIEGAESKQRDLNHHQAEGRQDTKGNACCASTKQEGKPKMGGAYQRLLEEAVGEAREDDQGCPPGRSY